MTKAYKGYEDLLDDFQGGIMPYETFSAERGMRQYGKELAAQAEMTRQLKDAEPEGAVSSFRSPGRRSPYLHGKDVARFAKRRGKLAGMRARVSGEALGEEQLNKRRYLYEQMQDEIAAMRAEQQAKKKKQQQVIKAIGQVSAMGIGMMTQAGSIAKKYDALSPVNDVVETEVDESAEADDAIVEALDTDADAIEGTRARQDEVVSKSELDRSEDDPLMGGAEEALADFSEEYGASISGQGRKDLLRPQLEQASQLIKEAKAELDAARSDWLSRGVVGGESGKRAEEALAAAQDRYDRLIMAYKSVYPEAGGYEEYSTVGGYEESLQEVSPSMLVWDDEPFIAGQR
tara:strand:- start:8912 stop:9949 length:1038 start_codon:yes stop_codon:yes gene_type:complete